MKIIHWAYFAAVLKLQNHIAHISMYLYLWYILHVPYVHVICTKGTDTIMPIEKECSCNPSSGRTSISHLGGMVGEISLLRPECCIKSCLRWRNGLFQHVSSYPYGDQIWHWYVENAKENVYN